MSDYDVMVKSIIEAQEVIMGPVAIDQAKHVEGMKIDWTKKEVVIEQDPKQTIDRLVAQYKSLFGQISVDVCKEAVGRLAQQLSPDQLPASLR